MLLLDVYKNSITIDIYGKDFHKDLHRIKKYSQTNYEPDEKIWTIPRNKKNLNKLDNNFKTVYQVDKYTLAGQESPEVDTAAHIVNQESDFDTLFNKCNLDQMDITFKDFQKIGTTSALYFLQKYGGMLIADDMGLGKTVQALGAMYGLKTTSNAETFLVSCPKNVKYQWKNEVEKFTDLQAVIIDGYNKEKRLESFDKEGDIYIINHDQLNIDQDFKRIKELNTDMIILDEIHYFTNHSAQRTKRLKELRPLFDYRLGLTGTPMENKPKDTHSIFEFLVPDLFGSWNEFKKKYLVYDYSQGYPRKLGVKNSFQLRKNFAKYMIRRETHEVSDELPNVNHNTHQVELNLIQKELHQEIGSKLDELKDEIESLRRKDSDQAEEELEELDGKALGMMNIQAEIVNDLRLLAKSDSNWVNSMVNGVNLVRHRSKKLEKLLDLSQSILDYNKEFKIIIFSKFARMVKLIKQELVDKKICNNVQLIYGDVNEKKRDENIQEFKEDNECRIIVMSDAGCEGLNLQNASHLINFDLPWNPAKLKQRNGRINRIGSKWDDIYITNIIAKNSIDQQILEAVNRKKATFDRLIETSDSQKAALRRFAREVV